MSIIAADIAIALPIALASIILLFSSMASNQSYIVSYAGSEYSQIKYYSISQQIISMSISPSNNYSDQMISISNLSRYYNVSVNFTSPDNYYSCKMSFCRVVEINGITRLMVIK